MTNPYQPPSSSNTKPKASKLLRPSVLAGCYLFSLSFLLAIYFLSEAVIYGSIFKAAPGGSSFLFGHWAYQILMQDDKARRQVTNLSVMMAIVSILLIAATYWSTQDFHMTVFWYKTKDPVVGAVLTATLSAIPAMILQSPWADKEFVSPPESSLEVNR